MPTDAPRAVTVPAVVAETVRRRWPRRGPAWVRNVLAEFDTACQRHQASPTLVFPARFGLVVAVITPEGPRVLRSSPDPAGALQAQVSVALAALGVGPAVHARWMTPHGAWTLTELVTPGARLKDVEASQLDKATLVSLAGTLRSMSRCPAPTGLPTVADWLRQRLADGDWSDLPSGRRAASPSERRAALAMLDDLAADSPPLGLCHGDLTFGNVLHAGAGRYALVDPRGVAGETAYDLAVVALSARAYGLPALGPPEALAAELAREVGEDPDRAAAWVTVAEAARLVRSTRAGP